MDEHGKNEFQRSATNWCDVGILAELWDFVRQSKKWWMLPILVVLLLFAALMLLGPAAPFIYTLF